MQHQDRREITASARPGTDGPSAPGPAVLFATPAYARDDRGGLIIHGFLDPGGQAPRPVDILFAEGGKTASDPLRQRLDALWHRARNAADRAGQPLPAAAAIRQPIHASGTWRIRAEGAAEDCRDQFVVASWTLPARDATPGVFGDRPIGAWAED